MTGMEVFLLLIGCIFLIGSFFVTEKLSSSEFGKLVEASRDELRKVMDREISGAENRLDETFQKKLGEVSVLAERAMEKEANEQVMQIHEYSETVLESIHKNHEEVMFLYSMLNDKHKDMTSMAGDLQRLSASIRCAGEQVSKDTEQKKDAANEGEQRPSGQKRSEETETMPQETEPETAGEEEISNDMVLKLYQEGMSKVEIAKRLGRGLGEITLVLELYKGEENL